MGYACSRSSADTHTQTPKDTIPSPLAKGPCTNYIMLKGWGGGVEVPLYPLHKGVVVGSCAMLCKAITSDSCSLHSLYTHSTKLLLNFSYSMQLMCQFSLCHGLSCSASFHLDVINLRTIVSLT